MLSQINEVFGIHETAVKYRSARANMLAANIANAETPGYRSRDIAFDQVLARTREGSAAGVTRLRTTHPRHFPGTSGGPFESLARYRQPAQSSLDQNTVDSHEEYARFADNAMRYQASLRFLNGRISGLLTALKGE